MLIHKPDEVPYEKRGELHNQTMIVDRDKFDVLLSRRFGFGFGRGCRGLSPGVSEGVSLLIPPGVSPGVSLKQSVPPRVSRGVPLRFRKGSRIPRAVPRGVPRGVALGAPLGFSEHPYNVLIKIIIKRFYSIAYKIYKD